MCECAHVRVCVCWQCGHVFFKGQHSSEALGGEGGGGGGALIAIRNTKRVQTNEGLVKVMRLHLRSKRHRRLKINEQGSVEVEKDLIN